MKNAILTTMSDSFHADFSSHPEIDVFLGSVKRTSDAELVIFSDKLNRDIPHILRPTFEHIFIDRWLYYYRFLCETSYDYVLLTDSRDVYFQTDPFEFISDKVLLTGEGFLHSDSDWNTTDQKNAQKSRGVSMDPREWPVVNGGIVLGPAEKVRDYCLLMFTNTAGRACKPDKFFHTDQAVGGLLWNTLLKFNPDYALSDPALDTFCITGEAVKQGKIEFPLSFENTKLSNGAKKEYALFHQWDRTEYAPAIQALFT